MTIRFGKWSPALLALATFALLGQPRAEAQTPALELIATTTPVGGGTTTTLDVLDNSALDQNPAIGVITLGSATTPLNFGPLQVFGSISSSNATAGSGNLAQLASSALTIINNTGTAQSDNFRISDQGFRFPPSPLTLFGTASGTFSPVPGSGNSTVDGSSAQALAFADTTKFGNQFTVQNFTVPPSPGSPQLSYANTQSASGFSYSSATGYSMTVQLLFTIGAFTQLNGRSNVEQAVSAVPEPSTVVMAVAGLPVLGGYWLRRRRSK